MSDKAKTPPKNQEKKKRRTEARSIGQKKGGGDQIPDGLEGRSVFLEIIFQGSPDDPAGPLVIAWTIHPEGFRGQILTGDRSKLAEEALEILHAHAHASDQRFQRVQDAFLESQGFSARIGALLRIHRARVLDRLRRRQLGQSRPPLDFDDYEAMERLFKKEV